MKKTNGFQISLAAFALMVSSAARAESMQDFWAQRSPIVTLTSNKSVLALEYCTALAAAEYGAPNVVHGEGVTLVSIMNPGQVISTVMGFRISENGGRRVIDVLARGSALGNWEKWARRTAESCA